MGFREHQATRELKQLGAALAAERAPCTADDEPRKQLREAAAAVERAAGEHALLDAAGVCAAFSLISIVVDATGHSSLAQTRVISAFRTLSSLKAIAARFLPFVLGAGTAVGAIYMARALPWS
mmetsp:Transcript_56034/g.112310  ORF Transcript_56034/g.112310 Transcript_56034/m.112310 type:complete len:123 (+) Transcript_56034:614-982(+)